MADEKNLDEALEESFRALQEEIDRSEEESEELLHDKKLTPELSEEEWIPEEFGVREDGAAVEETPKERRKTRSKSAIEERAREEWIPEKPRAAKDSVMLEGTAKQMEMPQKPSRTRRKNAEKEPPESWEEWIPEESDVREDGVLFGEVPEQEETAQEEVPQKPRKTIFRDTEKESPESLAEKKALAAEKKEKRRARVVKIGDILRISCICAVLFGGSVFLLVGRRETESPEDNRMLATVPTYSAEGLQDGSYVADWMHYYEDTVPGRSQFVRLIGDIDTYKGLQGDEEENVTFIGNVSKVTTEATTAATEAPTTTSTTAATTTAAGTSGSGSSTATKSTTTTATTTTVTTTTTAPPDAVEVGDGLMLVGTRAISLYGGSFSSGEAYADSLNHYKQDLGENVRVYSMVAPTAVSFYLPEEYADYTSNELEHITNINDHLNGVIPVDAYHALESHVDEAIYARTDHHWLPLGAYYAAQAFAKEAHVPYAELSEYTAVTKHGYVGSMYTFTKSSVLQENPEDFTYYIPQNDYSTLYYDMDFTNEREGNLLINLDNVDPVSWYLVFMGGDSRIAHVSTDVQNGRTLVMIKDSYGNAVVPCLTQSFEEIYVVDMRYMEVNAVSFCKQVGATDVLFCMNTFSATGPNRAYLEEDRTR